MASTGALFFSVSATIAPYPVLGVSRFPVLGGSTLGQLGEAAAALVEDGAAAVVGSSNANAGNAGVQPRLGSQGGGAAGAGRQNDDDDGVKELFLEQRLDHFDRQDSRTFSQRYFINKR